ncbi:hypothetical protein Tco_1237740 [Tanacetum coccineum]
MEYDSRVNERQTQTTEEKIDTSNAFDALDASSIIIESNGTESQKQDTSSRSGNDADIRPIYDEEPMVEILEFKTTANEQSNSMLVPKVVSVSKQDSTITTRRVEITIPPSHSNAEDNSHKVVRLGINPMIQPEPEDLPKDNPKLEIAVLRRLMNEKKCMDVKGVKKDSRSTQLKAKEDTGGQYICCRYHED